jgi:hypothetical protein
LGGYATNSKGECIVKKSIHSVFFAFVVLAILLSGCAPKPWVAVESIVTRDKSPIEQQNVSDQWEGALLAENLKFAGNFEMKLDMKSVGENIIGLTYTEVTGEQWWKGTKRMELACIDGKLRVILQNLLYTKKNFLCQAVALKPVAKSQ